jgi:hypothetical protein
MTRFKGSSPSLANSTGRSDMRLTRHSSKQEAVRVRDGRLRDGFACLGEAKQISATQSWDLGR